MRLGARGWRPHRVGAVALGVAVALAPAGARTQGPPRPAAAALAQRVHEVRPGDTLGALARRYGVSLAAIVTANRLPSARVVLRAGQRLVIPPAARAGAPRPPVRSVKVTARPVVVRVPAAIVLAVPDWAEALPLLAWPVEGLVTSTFGRRPGGWHQGIDIKAERGTPVLAAGAGVVVASHVEPRYGRVVRIEHADGFVTVYAHNEANLVSVGERVAPGATVATVGRTGRATTHHLHFEIRRAGLAYNPLYLLPLPPRIAQVDLTDENPVE